MYIIINKEKYLSEIALIFLFLGSFSSTGRKVVKKGD
jgi:hypothetical protein